MRSFRRTSLLLACVAALGAGTFAMPSAAHVRLRLAELKLARIESELGGLARRGAASELAAKLEEHETARRVRDRLDAEEALARGPGPPPADGSEAVRTELLFVAGENALRRLAQSFEAGFFEHVAWIGSGLATGAMDLPHGADGARAARIELCARAFVEAARARAPPRPPERAVVWTPLDEAARRSPKITLDVEDADLRSVVEGIARKAGRPVLVDPTVNECVTISRGVPLYEVPGE